MLRHRWAAYLIGMLCLIPLAPVGMSQEAPAIDGVNDAIKKGVEWLKGQQQANGSFTPPDARRTTGETALVMLALLKSDVDRKDPVIVKGFDFLEKSELADPKDTLEVMTYNVCVLILALEAYGQEDKTPGKTVVEKVTLKGQYKAWMELLHKWLMRNAVQYKDLSQVSTSKLVADVKITIKGLDKAGKIAWGYPQLDGPTKFDHSNTQYAVLAMKACERCGIKSPKEAWYGVLNHYLTTHKADGPEVARVGVESNGKTTFVSRLKDKARGWSYTYNESAAKFNEASGSMTSGSLGSLIMAKSVLLNEGMYKRLYAEHVDRAVHDGLAWLGTNFSVTENPKGESRWQYYYLYAIERIGMLAQITNVGDHLWYDEGAKFLVGSQGADGSWPAVGTGGEQVNPWLRDDKIINTCFALLFLKKSTMIVTGGSYQHKKEDEQKKE